MTDELDDDGSRDSALNDREGARRPVPTDTSKPRRRWGGWNAKYEKVWTLDMKEKVLEAFAGGACLTQVVVVMGISRSTFYDWLGAEGKEDFRETITHGTEIAKAWWLEQARLGLWSKEFNNRTFEMIMRNMYGWHGLNASDTLPAGTRGWQGDKSETVQDTVDTDEIIRKAKENPLDLGFPEDHKARASSEGEKAKSAPGAKKKPPMPPKAGQTKKAGKKSGRRKARPRSR